MTSLHQLSLSLYSSSRLLIQLIQRELNEIGITYPQFLVLSVLWEEDGLKVHEIGKRLFLDSGTLTPLLKKLEAMNYVQRNRGKVDERTVHIELTYPGKSLQSSVSSALVKLEETLIEQPDLSLEELNLSLKGLLDTLNTLKNN